MKTLKELELKIKRKRNFKNQLNETILSNLRWSSLIILPYASMICIKDDTSLSNIIQPFINIHLIKWCTIIFALIFILDDIAIFVQARSSKLNNNLIKSNLKEFILLLGLCTLGLVATVIRIYLSF